MSIIRNGTRQPFTTALTVGAETRSVNGSYDRDSGLAARAFGAFVFTTSPPQVALAGAFAAFPANTQILVEGSSLNNGLFYVDAVDPNGGFLTLSPPPKPETVNSGKIRVA